MNFSKANRKERERKREREGRVMERGEEGRAVPGLGMAYDRFLLETHE